MQLHEKSLMLLETEEIGRLVAAQAKTIDTQLQSVLDQVRARGLNEIVACGRGSSAHAIAYGQALFENYLDVKFVSTKPSTASLYHASTSFGPSTLALIVSQSGQSPDLLATAKLAKKAGSVTIALVNVPRSELASLCDFELSIGAYPEKSVAATKSCICAMTALAHLGARWKGNQDLANQVYSFAERITEHGPTSLAKALLNRLVRWEGSVAVLGRGLTTPIAYEVALKLKETSGLHAEAFSAAEFQHGPMALAGPKLAIIACTPSDRGKEEFEATLVKLESLGSPVIRITPSSTYCPSPLDPIVMLKSIYLAIEHLAHQRGYNPDQPKALCKVTETI